MILDLEREVSFEEGEELAKEYGFEFIETSALDGENTQDILPLISIPTFKTYMQQFVNIKETSLSPFSIYSEKN